MPWHEDKNSRRIRNYLRNAYGELLRRFEGRPFRLHEAAKSLGLKPSYMKNLLSELKNIGWVTSTRDPKDARSVTYNLDLAAVSELKDIAASSAISNHIGEYVLLVDGRIMDRDSDVQKLLRRALRKYSPSEIYITSVGRARELVTIGF